MTRKPNKKVDHPFHYNAGEIEAIDVIEDLGLGYGFCVGNAIKYIVRWDRKDKDLATTLEKAIWYLKRADTDPAPRLRPEACRVHKSLAVKGGYDYLPIPVRDALGFICEGKLSQAKAMLQGHLNHLERR